MGTSSLEYQIVGPILIVDDDISITKALSRILRQNYEVITANTIKQASKKLFEREFPVVILDYEMGIDGVGQYIDGVVFSKHISNMYPQTYIIMLTGHKDFTLVKRAINEGSINYFIHKPVETKKLKSVITEAYDNYSSNAELSTILQTPQGIENAKSLLSDVISLKIMQDGSVKRYEISAVIISKGSLPVYSRFFNEEIFQNFTDTLFAGFMSALVMVGDEVFSMAYGVYSLRFNKITIYFKFFDDYQISFIIYAPTETDEDLINIGLNTFTKAIEIQTNNDPLFFGWHNKSMPIIDELLIDLQNSL